MFLACWEAADWGLRTGSFRALHVLSLHKLAGLHSTALAFPVASVPKEKPGKN